MSCPKGFSSVEDFTRYGHLYVLSCILSGGQSFWFNDELYEACESKDIETLQSQLIAAFPPVQEFTDVINWSEIAESAITIRNFSNAEHNRLVEKLGLARAGL